MKHRHFKLNQVKARIEGRKALIACLADDRRVEIAVNGNQ